MIQISGFSIESLNDTFNYIDKAVDGSMPDLIILYGDNGSGKTTVLSMIFHLLSSSYRRGHLTAIAKVPFKSLKVFLSDGSIVSAERLNGVTSYPIFLKVKPIGSKEVEYRFIPDEQKSRVRQEQMENMQRSLALKGSGRGIKYSKVQLFEDLMIPNSDDVSHKKYTTALASLGITCYLIATDRRILSDAIEMRKTDSHTLVDPERDIDVITRIRTQYLKEAFVGAVRYINRQLIKASNTGSKNTNDIYAELIKRVSSEVGEVGRDYSVNLNEAMDKLKRLQLENNRLSKLNLVPEIRLSELFPSIVFATDTNKAVLDKILRPYIDSLEAQTEALIPIGNVVETFLHALNGLFKLKSIIFTPVQGFLIRGPTNQPLDVSQLSSGEQQLLLMFCYLLTSNESASIFMIDEPEISLNVAWQRELIDSMRRITKGSESQIVIATHSIELLTQFSDAVIDLDPTFSISNAEIYDYSKEETE